MNKKLFVLLVVLMSLSLIGIIFVQGYWISNSIDAKRGQFGFNAKQVLNAVARDIQIKEVNTWYNPVLKMRDSLGIPDDVSLYDLVYKQEDSITNESYVFRNSIVEQDYKLSSPILDYEVDSIKFKKYLQRQYTQIIDNNDIDKGDVDRTTIFTRMSDLSDIERYNIEQAVMYITRKIPIHKRVDVEELERLLTMELAERDMETNFEYAIYIFRILQTL